MMKINVSMCDWSEKITIKGIFDRARYLLLERKKVICVTLCRTRQARATISYWEIECNDKIEPCLVSGNDDRVTH